jgi:hypothetical protein
MRYRCLTCEALARPVYGCAATSPHIIDVELIRRGLHDHPADLRGQLQALIDATPTPKYDAILLAYGLCGQATAGLRAGSVPLVIPKAHDCITLFLGSRERYLKEFSDNPGTYWYSQDYIERKDGTTSSLAMGSGLTGDLEAQYTAFVEKYGQDNADYLMSVMGAWQQHYNRAAYIDLGIGDASVVEEQARQEAARRGWAFERMLGDLTLVRRLVQGSWDADFLVVPPGKQIVMEPGEEVIGVENRE